MPPRHTYWTILFGNQPTAFRAAEREELLPTFRQILAKHPDALMMWFARGRLWKSPEEARETLDRQRDDRPRGPKPEWRDRPQGDRPKPAWQNRGPKPEWRDRPQGNRPRGPKPEWQHRGPKPEGRDRPQGDRPQGPKPEWRDKERPRPERPARPQGDAPPGERRGRDWRPGGEHKDPRDRFKVPRDVKRARFTQNRRRERTNPRPPRKKKDEE